jgi:hypothetical protein
MYLCSVVGCRLTRLQAQLLSLLHRCGGGSVCFPPHLVHLPVQLLRFFTRRRPEGLVLILRLCDSSDALRSLSASL